MRARAALARALGEHEVVCVLGPGGVGKTTLSAALALLASRQRSTLVVTIDPAKRLASALGLELGHEISHVRPGLDAVMVDTKHALDQLLSQYAPSPERLGTILDSPLYQEISSALVGSEEFAAMGVLHEYYVADAYDLIVVDTPPSRHAIDFLTVNERLLTVFESGLTQFLFKPGRLFSIAGGRLAQVLARWTSRDRLTAISEFMLHFEDMFYEMEGRVRTMRELISDPSRTALGLVAVPEEGSVNEAIALGRGVAELGLSTSFTIANRVYPPLAGAASGPEVAPLLQHYARLAQLHEQGIARLAEGLGHVVVVPALGRVTGLAGLEALMPYLEP